MKESFLKKYQDYSRSRELKDEIFQILGKLFKVKQAKEKKPKEKKTK